jgi:hypothetical protein
MTDNGFNLSDVLSQLKRADDALTEFTAPLWPGVQLAAVWMEGAARLFRVEDVPAQEGYYHLATEGDVARPVRNAVEKDVDNFLHYLAKAKVLLLCDGLAFPASHAERLQGITGPRTIHLADGRPLEEVHARFDGINLFLDHDTMDKKKAPFGDLFTEDSIFAPGSLLGTPGENTAEEEAETVLHDLVAHPDQVTHFRLDSVLVPAGAMLEEWAWDGGQLTFTWRRLDEEYTTTIAQAASPITTGICLPGAKGFDPGRLTRMLLDHALDAWRG